ncbi:MAG TPA: hypothetical protein VFD04_01955 [Actinomycetes bacterium]|jgi:hypothetical protein|nr:hypothetical protein [Actinomycetes bacterium]
MSVRRACLLVAIVPILLAACGHGGAQQPTLDGRSFPPPTVPPVRSVHGRGAVTGHPAWPAWGVDGPGMVVVGGAGTAVPERPPVGLPYR